MEPPRWLDPERPERFRRFRAELATLGPLFALFGRYLSTRLDQLSGEDGRELAGLPDAAPALPEPAVLALLRAELPASELASLAHLEASPVESRALSQTHQGRLADGRAIRVKLARTDPQSQLDRGVLPRLAKPFCSLGWPLPAVRRMLADFDSLVGWQLDLGHEGEALRQLGRLPTGGHSYLAPRVLRGLSSARVLTLERPAGRAAFAAPSGSARRRPAGGEPGRTLADLWMHLVFDGLSVPEELRAADVRESAAGSLALGGGVFHPLSQDEADSLWCYLVAAAEDDTQAAFEALLALTRARRGARSQALRLQLGHAVPRRDGRFAEASPGLPELLLAHWAHVERHGLTAGPGLSAFYRGVVALRELLGPPLSEGVLREAVQVEQISRGSNRLRSALDPGVVTRGAEGALGMLRDLPRTLARSRPRRRPAAPPDSERGATDAREAGWARLAAGLLLAATLVLWFGRLPALLGSWTELALAVALALVGAGLLRSIWRG